MVSEYYPYGEEISHTADGREKFGTYTRESSSGLAGLDYANQRYYSSVYGRFTSADRHLSTDGASDPGSWNRYAYAGGDPANAGDPSGMVKFSCGDPNAASIYDGSCNVGSGSYGYAIECGFDWDFGFLYNDLAGCSAFYSAPGAAARAGGGDNSHKAPPQPVRSSCSISLYERPVPALTSPAFHTYLSVTDSDWNSGLLIEGGPTGNPLLSRLTGYDTHAPGGGLGAGTLNASDPSLSSNIQIGSTYRGGLACGAVQYLISAVDYYDSGSLAKYNFLAIPGTYNSNSFVYTLLGDLNSVTFGSVSGSFGQQVPGLVPGWGKRVPGL